LYIFFQEVQIKEKESFIQSFVNIPFHLAVHLVN
jgi:hypothetical protein